MSEERIPGLERRRNECCREPENCHWETPNPDKPEARRHVCRVCGRGHWVVRLDPGEMTGVVRPTG